jgi:hypothetical protein
MRGRFSMVLLTAFVFVQGLCLRAYAQTDDHDDSGPLQMGFVVITPPAEFADKLIVFETFGLKAGTQILQASVIPGNLTTNAMIFVNKSPGLFRDIGLALVNPGSLVATIRLTLRRSDGLFVWRKPPFVVRPRQHTARFVSELFADVLPTVPEDFIGTLFLESDTPVSLTVLRFRGFTFSTLPYTNLAPSNSVPVIYPGVGGPGAILLTQFVAGAGWASEIVIVNDSDKDLIGLRVDVFKQDGTILTTRLNHESKSTFFINQVIRPGGVFILAPLDTNADSRF